MERLMQNVIRLPLMYLDRTPMYGVIMQVLVTIYALALVASLGGYIGFTPLELILSASVIMVTALVVNALCATATKVPLQHYSSVITALILMLLLLPSMLPADLFASAVITALSIASKYIVVYKKQHLLNPVAVGLVLGTIFGFGGGAWWVASSALFIPLLVGGLLVAEKVKRLDMVAVFLSVAFSVYMFTAWQQPVATLELISTFFISYPYVFLACFMLTEPFTMPSQKNARYVYAGVVALVAFLPSLGPISFSPELALIIGNIALAPFAQRQKLILTLKSLKKVTPSIYEFSFPKPAGFIFKAGQYIEWMVPHKKSDSRGTRRYFTIVSAPEENELRLAFKLPANASSYKTAMVNLEAGDVVIGSQRSGDFILPTDSKVKLGFIAGGIGVTPFVSHVTSVALQNEKRDITTLYCVATSADLAYTETLSNAGALIPVIGSGEIPMGSESGFLSGDMITRRVPDYAARTWYISGPPPMVTAAEKILRSLGIPKHQIKKDFFPGLA
jgi:glycine betaine catabolism B